MSMENMLGVLRESGTTVCVFCEQTILNDVLGNVCGKCDVNYELDLTQPLGDPDIEFPPSQEARFKVVMDESVNKNRSSHDMCEPENEKEGFKSIENNSNYQELNKNNSKPKRKEKHMISERNAIRLECTKIVMDVCYKLDHFTRKAPGEKVTKEFVDAFFGDIDEVNIIVDRLMRSFVIEETSAEVEL